MSFHGMSTSFRMSSMIFHSMGTIFHENSMKQTHVEQSQLPHVGGNTLEGSAVGQSSCDGSGVQLVVPWESLVRIAVCARTMWNASIFRADDLFRTKPDFGCTGFAARVCE